jgi:hypothetical protein
MKCYSYLIGWSKLKKYYYGSRWSKNAHPKDLWKKYYTSSKTVKQFREENGEPDIIQVRRTFDTPQKAQRWEKRVLKKMKVVTNDKWLNRAVGGEVYSTSEDIRRRWKQGCYDNRPPQTEEHKRKNALGVIRYYQTHSHTTKGIPLKEEHKDKISKGLLNSEKFRKAVESGLLVRYGKDNGMYGKKHTKETLVKLKNKALNRKRIPCKLCKEEHQPGYMHLHLKRKHGVYGS